MPGRIVALVLTVLASGLMLAGLSATPAQAANVAISQCNNIGPSPEGATTAMTCTVTVVNTLSGTTTASTVTVVRQCLLGPCPSGNGTFTTSSSNLVTSVTQCNDSGNDAAHPIACNVTITNNISADTPGAQPPTAATVNQCVGSGGGGGGTVNCDPFPATTTTATVTQCNGSANGGGATIDCAVGTASRVSPAIPITVNQCNGTGNPGGSIVTCRTSVITNIIAAATATPTASTSATATPSATAASSATAVPSSTVSGTSTASAAPTGTAASATPQVSLVPTGGVGTGGGSTSGGRNIALLILGVVLLLAAAATARQTWSRSGGAHGRFRG